MVFLVEEDLNNKFVKYRMKSDRKIPYIEVNFNKKTLTKIRFIETCSKSKLGKL